VTVRSSDHDLAHGAGLVLDTATCMPEQLLQVGGKAVGLGALHRAGERVPASFVVATSAYHDYLRFRRDAPPGRADDLPAGMGEHLRRSIERSYEDLSRRTVKDVPVAVRSSATIEDSAEASAAGQFLTYLGARGAAEVIEKVEACWIAASAPHVHSYHGKVGSDPAAHGVAVIVQELVDARSAGVMFTQHPRTGDRSVVVIESSYGLGEAVVGGEVTPDLFEVNKITRKVGHRRLGTKAAEHRLSAAEGTERRPVEPDRQERWSISDEEVEALVAVAIQLEASLGRGLDVEWAIGTVRSDDRVEQLFTLQARPITVSLGAARGLRPASPEPESVTPAASPAARSRGIDLALGRLSSRISHGGAP
jgi:phosphoenolpyruvate synthase/pyruvate phosphate dikinase